MTTGMRHDQPPLKLRRSAEASAKAEHEGTKHTMYFLRKFFVTSCPSWPKPVEPFVAQSHFANGSGLS